ncbi:MAG: hypothetical protein GEV09_03775 [Pseudonocardiaceae bacterium]|nr:hypothetical protein [Pseudonocardiaceae bacterium]
MPTRDEVTVQLAAAPERVWELVSDITRMGEWSPENTGGCLVRASPRGQRPAGA